MSEWEYVPEVSVRLLNGIPINKDGYSISCTQPSNDFIVKAKIVLTELFALLDRLDIDLAVDSEQDVSTIYIDDDDSWTVSYSTRERATIERNSYAAGTLILT